VASMNAPRVKHKKTESCLNSCGSHGVHFSGLFPHRVILNERDAPELRRDGDGETNLYQKPKVTRIRVALHEVRAAAADRDTDTETQTLGVYTLNTISRHPHTYLGGMFFFFFLPFFCRELDSSTHGSHDGFIIRGFRGGGSSPP